MLVKLTSGGAEPRQRQEQEHRHEAIIISYHSSVGRALHFLSPEKTMEQKISSDDFLNCGNLSCQAGDSQNFLCKFLRFFVALGLRI